MVLKAKYKQQLILSRLLISQSVGKKVHMQKKLYMQSNGLGVGVTVEWLESEGPQAKDNTPSTRQDERAVCLQLMHLALKGIGR